MMKNHLNRIDVLRAVAILLVFFFHYWLLAKDLLYPSSDFSLNEIAGGISVLLFPFSIGYLGVKLFFVISGFCIHYSFLNWKSHLDKPSVSVSRFLPVFFWRRFWRIYPPYLLTLLFFYWCLYSKPFAPHPIRDLALHAALLQNLFPGFFFSINGSFWSIAAEWQLYLIYPLFLWIVLHKRIEVAFGVATLSAILINYVAPHLISSYFILKSPFAYWFEWTIGALLADYFVRGLKLFRWHRGLLAILFVLLCVAYNLPSWQASRFYISTIFFAVLVESVIHFERPVSLIEKLLIPVGLCSYSLYLVHQPYLVWLFKTFPSLWIDHSALWVWGILPWLLLAPILGFSWLYYKLIEKGSISLGGHLWTKVHPKLLPLQVLNQSK